MRARRPEPVRRRAPDGEPRRRRGRRARSGRGRRRRRLARRGRHRRPGAQRAGRGLVRAAPHLVRQRVRRSRRHGPGGGDEHARRPRARGRVGRRARPAPGRRRCATRWRGTSSPARSTCAGAASAAAGWCSSAAGRATRGWSRWPGSRPSRPPTSWSPTGSAPPGCSTGCRPTSRSSTWARARRTTRCRRPRSTAILVDRALQGLTVVRFKGGDPYVFGRGGEEVHACRAAGVEVTVVPGITSAFSVPALAGIPVTQRGVATSVHVSSGHVGADAASIAALAAGATVVYLMAVSALPGHLRRGARGRGGRRPARRDDRAGLDRARAGHPRDRGDRGGGRRRARGCARRPSWSWAGSRPRASSTTRCAPRRRR